MSLARYAKRKDGNQTDVVVALRADGFKVCVLDVPVDLLVWEPGSAFLLFEVKDDGGQLTPAQVQFFMQSEMCKRFLVRSPEEARRIAWIELRGRDPE